MMLVEKPVEYDVNSTITPEGVLLLAAAGAATARACQSLVCLLPTVKKSP